MLCRREIHEVADDEIEKRSGSRCILRRSDTLKRMRVIIKIPFEYLVMREKRPRQYRSHDRKIACLL